MESNKIICDILIFIDENITSKIIIKDLERNLFYNRFYLMKLFKKELGLTIIEYINSLRIYKSISYIRDYNYSLMNIAWKSGFSSLEYFSETFKKITNLKPSVFKIFFKYRQNVSPNDTDKIEDALFKLYEINNLKSKYIARRKPDKLPVKRLSIFK